MLDFCAPYSFPKCCCIFSIRWFCPLFFTFKIFEKPSLVGPYYYYYYYYYIIIIIIGLALKFLQFQAMLLFAKALCYSLHLISSVSLSIFSISLLGLQLQLEQPQLVTSSRSFSLPVLVHCNCLSFPVLSTQSFCPEAQQYQ